MTEAHVTDDLGLYALGLLDGAELAAVERHLRSCADCRAALAAEENAAWRLAEAAARDARPGLQDAIVARHRPAVRAWRWQLAFAAAAVVAAIALGALVATRAELAEQQRLRDEYARALDAVAQGGRVFPLQARAGVQGSGALVVTRDGDPYLVLALPAPPAGKAYEAWIIRGGVPNRAGLAPAREGTITLRLDMTARPGDVAAVTLEDAGGVDRPTSEPLMVVGIGGLG
jgi:anti-sigma factor RsiW